MTNTLKIIHWNCRRIGNKIAELQHLALDQRIVLVLLNKTHLKNKNQIKITNFPTCRNNSPAIPSGHTIEGGTSILTHESITHQDLNI